MNHLSILYFILTTFIGTVSISILLLIIIKTKKIELIKFFMFFLNFTLVVVSKTVLLYLTTNLLFLDHKILVSLLYFHNILRIFLIFTIVFFAHTFIFEKNHRILDFIFLILTTLTIIIFIFTTEVNIKDIIVQNKLILKSIGLNFYEIFFIFINIYSVILGIIKFNKVEKPRKKVLLIIISAIIIFIPLIILDFIGFTFYPFFFFPFLYVFFATFITYNIIRIYNKNINENINNVIVSYKNIETVNYADIETGKLLKYLGDNYFNPDLSVKSVSYNAGVPYLKIPEILQNRFNLTFPQYLNAIRLAEAKRLLRETDLQIIEIALKVGFNNISYFNRIFKKVEKKPPFEYRKTK